MSDQDAPIGVFDSGIGGLTVLKSLMQHLPHESFIYLGDTARLPYGTKSAQTILRYTLQTAELLVKKGIKILVLACNTASSVALEPLQLALPEIPVIGVIKSGAMAAVAASKNGHIGVIATESTVHHGAYERAIGALQTNLLVHSRSCPLLVALAEEGWHDGAIVEAIIRRYIEPLCYQIPGFNPDCLVLGCTHFPVLRSAIQRVVGPDVTLVDSAHVMAGAVAELLQTQQLQRQTEISFHCQFLATDAPARFARIATQFLGYTLSEHEVSLVDL